MQNVDDEITPYTGIKYIVYLGDDGDRFKTFCEMVDAICEKVPIRFIRVNCDNDRKRRLDALMTLRRLKLLDTIILLTHMSPYYIDVLTRQAVAVIHPDSYDVVFNRDGTRIPMTDIKGIYNKLMEVTGNGQ